MLDRQEHHIQDHTENHTQDHTEHQKHKSQNQPGHQEQDHHYQQEHHTNEIKCPSVNSFNHTCDICKLYIDSYRGGHNEYIDKIDIVPLLLIDLKRVLHPFIYKHLNMLNVPISGIIKLVPINWIDFIYKGAVTMFKLYRKPFTISNWVKFICGVPFQRVGNVCSLNYIFFEYVPSLTHEWNYGMYIPDIYKQHTFNVFEKLSRCSYNDLQSKYNTNKRVKFGSITKRMMNCSAITDHEIRVGSIYYCMKCSDQAYKPTELMNATTNLSTSIKNGVKPIVFTVLNHGITSHIRYCIASIEFDKYRLLDFITTYKQVNNMFHLKFTNCLQTNNKNLVYGLYLILECCTNSDETILSSWEDKFLCRSIDDERSILRFQRDLLKRCDKVNRDILTREISSWWNKHYTRDFRKDRRRKRQKTETRLL